ncbi:hypothetical protein BJ546DRAFT_596580 [Cryomyces antarcticus]
MPEQVYVNESKKLAALFDHPSVEGVYEKQVPLNVRAVMELGSVCTFNEKQRGVLGKGLEYGFDLSALRRVSAQQPYLTQSPLGYLYLYHLVAGDRQIYALFSSTKKEAHVVVLNKARAEQSLPNLDKIYRDMFTYQMQEAGGEPWQSSIEYQDDIHFKTVQVTVKRRAYLEIGDAIKKLQKEEKAPLLLVIQSQQHRMLKHDIPILRDFPILPLKPDESDMQLPPLGWQSFVAKRIVTHYLRLGTWISHLVDLARYGDIPLCNLERDDPRYLIDIAYARRLQKDKVVLWWSAAPKPDHAGYEKDDILGALETVDTPSVNNPGTYSSVCIDLNIQNLAINTILSSALINEAEGADSVSFNPAAPNDNAPSDGSNIIYSDNAFATAGITVLREMVKSWHGDAVRGDTMADTMVQHLVRWVESPGSFLYDRSLHYYVQMMSRKALQQLMTDFRRVGSHIVYASTNRLLLQTTKAEVGNAYAYSQYILKTVAAKPLFHFLDLEIKEYWDYLVWYDEFNYGGKGCIEVVEAEKQTLEMIMHWQFAMFLPLPLQPMFNEWVVEYIELMHARKRPAALTNGTPRATQLPIHAAIFKNQKGETDGSTTPGNVLTKTFTRPLLKQLAALMKRQHNELMHADLAPDWAFPSLPGSHLKLTNPALQLVKSVMQVLSLDKTITLEARLLRKELLQLFDIREFSPDGTFANPSTSLCIRQLVCPECTIPRDLDLCRDSDLLPPPALLQPATGAIAPLPQWKCPNCDSAYDKLAIEERLLAEVEKAVVEWATQDLKCAKCRRVRVNDFMEHCSCAGEWVGTIKREELVRRMGVWRRAAAFYGFTMLENVVREAGEGL